MRLSITGEKQRDCVEELLKTLPTVTTYTSNKRAKFSCDRGYTNEAFLAQRALKLFNAISINNAAARNPFISSEQLEEWIEGCRGKKLFQVLDSDGKPMKDADGKNKINQEKVEQCTAIMEEYVVPVGGLLGTEVYVAHKDIMDDNGATYKGTAIAVRDVFDKKKECKILPFLATGNAVRDKTTSFVCSPKSNYTVTSSHLFSEKTASEDRKGVEKILNDNGCSASTVAQKDIMWFGLKGFAITGTGAGKVHARSSKLQTHPTEELIYDSDEEEDAEEEEGEGVKDTEEDDGIGSLSDSDEDDVDDTDVPHEVLVHMFDKLIDGWFKRHISTSAMAEGTKNEDPTAQKFAAMDFVLQFYEVGLLTWDEANYIAVSPDGIAWVKVPGDEHQDQEKQLAVVEIKTRTKPKTIAKAEKARDAVMAQSVSGDGRVVVCEYNDKVFKTCVPSSNRKQVIHQALVTGLTWGVFITAKVEEGQGSIVQIVFVHFSEDQKREYSRVLLRMAKPLASWIYNEDAILRGYLEEEDFPEWVTPTQRLIVASRFRMWSALWRYVYVHNNGPFMPMGMLKLSMNFEYNKGKWGLDMCTENNEKVTYDAVALTLESKYVMLLLDSVTANGWKSEQACTIIKPWYEAFKEKHDGARPSNKQIRAKAKELTLEDYVFNLSIDWLKSLEQERIALAYAQDIRGFFPRRPSGPQDAAANSIRRTDEEMLELLRQRKTDQKWPVAMRKAQTFSADPKLDRLRVYSSEVIRHSRCQFEKKVQNIGRASSRLQGNAQNRLIGDKHGRQTCAMCTKGRQGRQVRQYCSICGVGLCVKIQTAEGYTRSCWDEWHNCDNLETEWRRRGLSMVGARNAKAGTATLATTEAADEDDSGDETAGAGDETATAPAATAPAASTASTHDATNINNNDVEV